jgi:hypothetical protein
MSLWDKLAEPRSIEGLASDINAPTAPTTPVSAFGIGANPDQAKMAGTPNQLANALDEQPVATLAFPPAQPSSVGGKLGAPTFPPSHIRGRGNIPTIILKHQSMCRANLADAVRKHTQLGGSMFIEGHIYTTRNGLEYEYRGEVAAPTGPMFLFSACEDEGDNPYWLVVDEHGFLTHTRSTNLDIMLGSARPFTSLFTAAGGTPSVSPMAGVSAAEGGGTAAVPTTGGLKFDNGKPDLSIVPYAFLEQVARVLMFGEGKYGRENYRQGFVSHRLTSACLRHIFQWIWVEENDPESGFCHLAHAAACLAMIFDCRTVGTLAEEDRPCLHNTK